MNAESLFEPIDNSLPDYSEYYKVPRQETHTTDFWTNILYRKGYETLDEKWPVVIPSYNRPDNKFLVWTKKYMRENRKWPVYFIVRESQKEMYEKTIEGYDSYNIVSFKDELINDIGKVREQAVNYFYNLGYKFMFMIDDDITDFGYTVPLYRNGLRVSYTYRAKDFGGSMAMWQLAMMAACKKEPKTVLSSGAVQGFSWVEDACFETKSCVFMRGLPTLAVCLNLQVLHDAGLNYRTIVNNGHDDIDLLIRALLKGCVTADFRWLSYGNPGIGTSLLGFDTVKERFERQYNEMYANFKDVPFVKWRERKGIKNVGIVWTKCIDYFFNNGFGNFKNNRSFDIWDGGKLLG